MKWIFKYSAECGNILVKHGPNDRNIEVKRQLINGGGYHVHGLKKKMS